jgi:hypothetical protein
LPIPLRPDRDASREQSSVRLHAPPLPLPQRASVKPQELAGDAEAEAKIAGGWEGFAARVRQSHIDHFEEKVGKGGFDPYVATWTVRRDLAEKAARSNQYVGCITRARPIWSQSSRS